MTANQFRLAVAWAMGETLAGAGAAMVLHLKTIWTGPLLVAGLIMLVAVVSSYAQPRTSGRTEATDLRAELTRIADLAEKAIPEYRAVGSVAALECAEVHRVYARQLRKLAGGNR